ncbi:Ca-activated chloride channel family protein [Allocatelliglobosispora scoriae]|uniref:Ca-activated chloride channel family protein n=1 Tax=Allocatelliglobosispora scoriae TaxID=643052 RepID=A0A841BR05_9ACTN|nr:VWA domain-containing protein [Allocatelliglobosispora scoriae]MBB5870135.1 Ca-activated chloride channel family protein [Allocatelliglobosispora scoriae]
MTMLQPLMVLVAVVVTGGAVVAYLMYQRRRTEVLQAAGLRLAAPGQRAAARQHVPYALFLTALFLLLLGLARPQAELDVPRAAGTVVLVFDVSNSMAADDVKPSRLAAAKAAGTSFVDAQPDTVDIGIVMFGQDGLTTQRPTDDHTVVNAAIGRLATSGGTSLRQAIIAALSTITGKPVSMPNPDGSGPKADLGYWGSATIVIFSDGGDTQGAQAEIAAGLAADAGVRIETVGIGTTRGATVEVDGYQVATALDEELLTTLAETTGGSYHAAQDAAALNDIHKSIDLRITTQPETVELTAILAAVALLLLTIGGLLMIRWHGRIV